MISYAVLIVADIRHVGLTLLLAWGGIVVSRSIAIHPLYGIIGGLMVASLPASGMLLLWLVKTLKRAETQAQA